MRFLSCAFVLTKIRSLPKARLISPFDSCSSKHPSINNHSSYAKYVGILISNKPSEILTYSLLVLDSKRMIPKLNHPSNILFQNSLIGILITEALYLFSYGISLFNSSVKGNISCKTFKHDISPYINLIF